MKSLVEWLDEHLILSEYSPAFNKSIFDKAKKMETKNKLEKQLFIGKVSEIIGFEKTVELLKEAKQEINTI